jgi:CRISPR-associated protein Cmr6
MKLDISEITKAKNALIKTGIVNKENKYNNEFKGYISSFGVTIILSGIDTAITYYSEAKTDRIKVIQAIELILNIDSNKLSDFLSIKKIDTHKVLRAVSALKFALRLYETGGSQEKSDTEVKNETEKQKKNREEYLRKIFPPKENVSKIKFKANDKNLIIKKLHVKENDIKSFSLKTTYPGLLIGAGDSTSEVSVNKIKNRLFIDYTTGYPIIPGSSVKGVLRSVFPYKSKDKSKYAQYNSARIDFLIELFDICKIDLLKDVKDNSNKREDYFFQLTESFFNENVVYFDAVITNNTDSEGKILDIDYITPHNENPMAEPIPVKIERILPNITFTFYFKFKKITEGISVEQKLHLFKQILMTIGIGAKTNLGYGQLQE